MFRLMLSVIAVTLAILSSSPAADRQARRAVQRQGLDRLEVEGREEEQVGSVPGSVASARHDQPRRVPGGRRRHRQAEKTPSSLVNVKGGGSDIFTEQKFGDLLLELEFMVPKGSNSGVYLMGEYEVQILDSFGKPDDKLTQGDLGRIYTRGGPEEERRQRSPASGRSSSSTSRLRSSKGDKKIANAKFIKVTLNDVVLHENVEMKQQTPGGLTGKEAATGPLMFQGDHGPVAFRNIKITPRK